MYSFLRSIGFCLGVAMGEAMFQNVVHYHSGTEVGAEMGGYTLSGASLTSPGLDDTMDSTMVLAFYMRAFRVLWATMSGISIDGLRLSLTVTERTLGRTKDLESSYVARRLAQGGKA
ncbi:hypothetical protein LTR17_024964 [Elasticomyces elasticus]|nr:hypothetical protein LTR17_024964 [Elasticomyces elasticus]